MIFPAAFIFTLFLTHIVRALPQASGGSINPVSSTLEVQDHSSIPVGLRSTLISKYDDPYFPTRDVTCSYLADQFPRLGNIPSCFIGGAFDVSPDFANCGDCWEISNPKNGKSIRMVAIDRVYRDTDLDIGARAFMVLGDGEPEGELEVEARKIDSLDCLL
jgi:hypothetical protein